MERSLVYSGTDLSPKRSNYTEQKETLFGVGDGDEEGAKPSNRARETLNLRNDGKQKKKSTAAVRSILLYRKTFNALLEESVRTTQIHPFNPAHGHPQGLADAPGPNYLTAAAPPSKYPSRMLCQVCGYFGSYRCKKCGIPYCTIPCRDTHDETGCERRLVA